MYDIFSPSELSDDELFSRIQQAHHFLGVHMDAGHDSLVHSIVLTIAVMEEEQEYRMKKKKDEFEKESKERANRSTRRRGVRGEKEAPEQKKDDGSITIGRIEGIDK